jgi:tetratricopeptide (TPR) repeat protein
LTSLGGALQASGATASANFLFDEVLEFAPGNEAALLGLAAFHEKVGNYDKARDYLEQLVRHNPDNTEGWLRYAMNLQRCGEKKGAREWLAKARKEPAPTWVRSLAYQELARMEMDDGALDRAELLLREGIDALPGEQRLYLQLALVLDHTGRGSEAGELVERLTEVPVGGESARYVYNRWPRSVIELGRRQLKETAESRRGVLARAIRESAPVAGGGGR